MQLRPKEVERQIRRVGRNALFDQLREVRQFFRQCLCALREMKLWPRRTCAKRLRTSARWSRALFRRKRHADAPLACSVALDAFLKQVGTDIRAEGQQVRLVQGFSRHRDTPLPQLSPGIYI